MLTSGYGKNENRFNVVIQGQVYTQLPVACFALQSLVSRAITGGVFTVEHGKPGYHCGILLASVLEYFTSVHC